jgi:hypothetical protein
MKPHSQIPVFIKLKDGGSFNKRKTKVISEIIQELENEIGSFAKGGVTIAAGGDIFIRNFDPSAGASIRNNNGLKRYPSPAHFRKTIPIIEWSSSRFLQETPMKKSA